MTVYIRPDGRTYRPRRTGLRAVSWENDYPNDYGLIILGTLDPDRAETFATESGTYWYGEGKATSARPGWWRDGYDWTGRAWITDEQRGAPGVWFTWEAD